MTDDLIARLREPADWAIERPLVELREEAADRIEALSADVLRLQVALHNLLEDTQHVDHNCGDEDWCPVIAARAALEGDSHE